MAQAPLSPGLARGAYPQRDDDALPAWLGRLRRHARFPAVLRRWQQRGFVARVMALAEPLPALDAAALDARLHRLRAYLGRDGLTDAHLAEAFALVREVTRREIGLAHFDTQLIAARLMLAGSLAEMATGEGKTLAALLAAATGALAGIPVHVITSNDYLVERDAERVRPVFTALGLTVGTVTQPMAPAERAAAYGCHATYCTAKELVFDYLRDHLAFRPGRGDLQRRVAQLATPGSGTGQAAAGPLLRGLCLALVDEADSILIDEARTPLILSQNLVTADETGFHAQALRLAGLLLVRRDYTLDPQTLSAHLTAAGRKAVQSSARRLGPRWGDPRHGLELVALALAARHLFQRDRHYLVRDGQVAIIDETTGRVAEGRVWSRGLHTLIELKEGCEPTGTQSTMAQITYQRFFPRYLRLGGMSGTLHEARGELMALYGAAVHAVPLRRPSRRARWPMRLFGRSAARWQAVVHEVARLHAEGRPVLVGTDSVADSEHLSTLLQAHGLPHAVLNARHDSAEAELVADAGHTGRITVATNMAGRGTDIPLGAGVAERGGLHVICCQHNAARRIDRQLQGRCARQGEPGSFQALLSLEDGLFATHAWAARLGAWLLAMTPRAAQLPGWLAPWLAALPQQVESMRQARARGALQAQDAALDRQLSFGGRGE
jgi:preprotein translocase subunit SecA